MVRNVLVKGCDFPSSDVVDIFVDGLAKMGECCKSEDAIQASSFTMRVLPLEELVNQALLLLPAYPHGPRKQFLREKQVKQLWLRMWRGDLQGERSWIGVVK